MTKDRSLDELKLLWFLCKTEEQRWEFINETATAREVYRLDQAGYLNWQEVPKE